MTSLEDNDVDMFLEERFHQLRISTKMSVVSPPNGSSSFSTNSPRNRRFSNPFDVPSFLIKSEQMKNQTSSPSADVSSSSAGVSSSENSKMAEITNGGYVWCWRDSNGVSQTVKMKDPPPASLCAVNPVLPVTGIKNGDQLQIVPKSAQSRLSKSNSQKLAATDDHILPKTALTTLKTLQKPQTTRALAQRRRNSLPDDLVLKPNHATTSTTRKGTQNSKNMNMRENDQPKKGILGKPVTQSVNSMNGMRNSTTSQEMSHCSISSTTSSSSTATHSSSPSSTSSSMDTSTRGMERSGHGLLRNISSVSPPRPQPGGDQVMTMLRRVHRVHSTKKFLALQGQEQTRRYLPAHESTAAPARPTQPKPIRENLRTQLLEHKLGQKLGSKIRSLPHSTPTKQMSANFRRKHGLHVDVSESPEYAFSAKRARCSPPPTPRAHRRHSPQNCSNPDRSVSTSTSSQTTPNPNSNSRTQTTNNQLFRERKKKHVPRHLKYMEIPRNKSVENSKMQLQWDLERDVPLRQSMFANQGSGSRFDERNRSSMDEKTSSRPRFKPRSSFSNNLPSRSLHFPLPHSHTTPPSSRQTSPRTKTTYSSHKRRISQSVLTSSKKFQKTSTSFVRMHKTIVNQQVETENSVSQRPTPLSSPNVSGGTPGSNPVRDGRESPGFSPIFLAGMPDIEHRAAPFLEMPSKLRGPLCRETDQVHLSIICPRPQKHGTHEKRAHILPKTASNNFPRHTTSDSNVPTRPNTPKPSPCSSPLRDLRTDLVNNFPPNVAQCRKINALKFLGSDVKML